MVHHSSYEFNRNPETETEYKRLIWWSRRLQKEWREDNPNEVWLPFLLKAERTIYGDIKKLDSGEIQKRNRMVRDKIMLHRFLDLGCGHQGSGECRHIACSFLWEGVQATYAACLEETGDEQEAMSVAMAQFRVLYDSDHYFSWAKTRQFNDQQNIIAFIEEVVRSNGVSTCCMEHVRKTKEWQDNSSECTIRGKAGQPEDKDDVYANIVIRQDDGMKRQKDVLLETELHRISRRPLSAMPLIQGTPFEHYNEPEWYHLYIWYLRLQYDVELNYSLTDSETRIYDTVTTPILTDVELTDYLQQRSDDLDKFEEELIAARKTKSKKSGIMSFFSTASMDQKPLKVDQKPRAVGKYRSFIERYSIKTDTSFDTECTSLNTSLNSSMDDKDE
ncbi:hypothetical protein FRACYDRAFT_243093 [Fragilariopsis cylindrus CCMP1102]|uniref:Uncharacterized protein n=1 Tax=Fragilariopsis cylindrus CCMP1102 TaxID=635003 RepID=A0A1E7F4Y2_9STRA|nr:hypothetical protein FRACYDRAFT_243093 [Fragilariopsis cylindrus CCMP1102]|eukprot:OEU13184.1 hypothetical protein FRACYDRAFT_243093 [Fragilariopsis cylindrus CCMP1102]